MATEYQRDNVLLATVTPRLNKVIRGWLNFFTVMSVRAYNPSVRVGNWNEDLCLEEVWEFTPQCHTSILSITKLLNIKHH